jgi:hypothetical protein
MEKLFIEFSDDLKRYLDENKHDIVSILRSSGYSVTKKNENITVNLGWL